MNKLLRYIFFVLLIICTGNGDLFAQVNNFRRSTVPNSRLKRRNPKLDAAHDRFLSQQLSLTSEESAKFWPIYRRYQQDLTAITILKRQNNSSSTANGMDQINTELKLDNQMVEIRKHYRDEFLKILPPEKVSTLYKSEVEFRNELIKQMSERSIRAGN